MPTFKIDPYKDMTLDEVKARCREHLRRVARDRRLIYKLATGSVLTPTERQWVNRLIAAEQQP